MDNRRVVKSYKTRVKSQSGHGSAGLVSKFKRFFSGTNSTTSDNGHAITTLSEPKVVTTDTNRTSNGRNTTTQSTANNSIRNANGSMINTTVSVPGSFESPNKIISSFFEQKGDDPLTQVEYEGIVSLINKSKNNESFVDNSSFVDLNSMKPIGTSSKPQPPDTNERSFANSRSLRIPQSRKHSISTDIYNTPYNQRTLKVNNSAVFSTPDYTPAYHTISNTTLPSVKRVYQFSGLPSPYKTRIRPPSSISKNPNGNTTIGSIATISETPSTKRLRSSTANTLLSILDNKNDGKKQKSSEEIAPFVNPYKANNKKKRTTITANDIKKTMSFDTSEKLAGSGAIINGPAQTEDKKQAQGDEKTKLNSNENGKPAINTSKPTISTEKPTISTEKPTTSTEKPNPLSFATTSNGTTDTKFNFGPISIPTPTTSNGQEPQEKSASSSTTHSKPFPDTNNNPSTSTSTYQFPKVDIIQVTLDHNKVEGYLPLFSF